MSQQYEYPPPPPPRSPASLAAASGASVPEVRRRAPPAQPPSLATNLGRPLGQAGQPSYTPISAATLAPGSPYPFTPATPVQLPPRPQSLLVPPGSPMVPPRSPSMEPYNPRQWSSRQPVSGSQMVFSQRGAHAGPSNTRETTGMEASMPSPPPPYSAGSGEAQVRAPANAGSSPLLDTVAFTSSPAGLDTSTNNSPQVPMSPAFPPPPGQASKRERSSSGQRSFFSLSNLRGKQPAASGSRPTTFISIPESDGRPPAAKRAASAGQLQSPTAETASPARGPSPESGWQPGMPLPGPPPGPPPAGARTQSLNRYPESSTSRSNSQSSERSIDASSRIQRRTMTASSLGPIPPTPADWVDPDAAQQRQQTQLQSRSTFELPTNAYQPLRIDTGSGNDNGLARRPAKRDGSLQGLRERRSQSRANRESISDRVFSPAEGAISQRREHARIGSAQTSPLSQVQASNATASNVLTPPYTPAVGKSKQGRNSGLKAPDSAGSDRPISHILHQPVDDSSGMPAPLTPVRPPSSSSFKSSVKLDAFYSQAIERHRKFIEQEAAASSDEERLELFASFMVHESRMRRDRYPAAYNSMAGDIMDLTRDMWRSFNGHSKRPTPSHSMSSHEQPSGSWASDGQPNSAQGNAPSSASSFGDFTPITDSGSIPDANERQWGEQFKPSLSPIPSMNVSSVRDDDSSRGRTASRWWEEGQSGSGSVGRPDRLEKSQRETKYMGIKPGDLQGEDQSSPRSSRYTGSTPNASANALAYGPDEYPPEKVGWHESVDYDTPQATPGHMRERKTSTPGKEQLDVSRLVTLPPPYPRHHPAINNSHPLMADLRNEHRLLSDQSKIREIKDAYIDQDYGIQKEQQAAAKERRSQLRSGVQEKIADGTISFAEAAQAEMDFDQEEAERGKANARSNFDLFEASMSHPLNSLLTERLEKANACITQLRIELESRNEISDPNQAQEEGDEQPERLEKLTLLKWLFECREQLHKEMFDLHAERSAKYSEVILTPYCIAKMTAKIDEATSFFSKDSQQRQASYAKEALKRYEELQQIVDTNVSRGVEDQLSAFWDIAPGLLAVIQAVPGNVADLEIQIPEREFDENPAYIDWPLQYLYSLLSHASRSAYQFIESQTNLLCLLHEVRTATMKARLRLQEIESSASPGSGGSEAGKNEIGALRAQRERDLTADLKEKVGEVERQWREALGEEMEECKERVRGFLVVNGGWEDGLDG